MALLGQKKFVWAWQNFSITVYRIPVATKFQKVNGYGSVGRAVASNTRDPRFESRYRQNFIYQLHNQFTEKTKLKKKRSGMAHLKNKVSKREVV